MIQSPQRTPAYCPHPVGKQGNDPKLLPIANTHSVFGFSWTNYRLKLLLPPALVAGILYSVGEQFNQTGAIYPYGLMSIGIPLSFVSVLVMVVWSADIARYGRTAGELLGSIRRICRTCLLVTAAYVGTLILVSGIYWQSPTDLRLYFVGVTDLYGMATFSTPTAMIPLTVPIQVLYYFTLTAAIFQGHGPVNSVWLALRTIRRNWKQVMAYSLAVGLLSWLAQGLPSTIWMQNIYEYLLTTTGLQWAVLGSYFAVGFLSAKVLFASLFFLWAAAIYNAGTETWMNAGV
jgi:hypothetical protein